jgi:hypothetical protein
MRSNERFHPPRPLSEDLFGWPPPFATPLPHQTLSKEERHVFEAIQRHDHRERHGRAAAGGRSHRP